MAANQDSILLNSMSDKTNTIIFEGGIKPGNVLFNRRDDNLVITVKPMPGQMWTHENDSLTVENYFGSDQKVSAKEIHFIGDSTILTYQDIVQAVTSDGVVHVSSADVMPAPLHRPVTIQATNLIHAMSSFGQPSIPVHTVVSTVGSDVPPMYVSPIVKYAK